MIESRAGKYAVVSVLVVLATILATSRPRKPRVVFPLAAFVGFTGVWIAWRAKAAPPFKTSFPLGDPVDFIDTVPAHVARLREWSRGRSIPPPPPSVSGMQEWLWSNREALGEDWGEVMHGLVAAYGETLRAETRSLIWAVRGGEPAVGAPRSLWPARRIFNEVHDAVFADV